ncbi:hypothetical protein GCM10010300_46890 [Streptomyces olivaceoviridis]|nr:hypothetical protein GCM10010300_46890 [Streptomyces olivaceoviridis]
MGRGPVLRVARGSRRLSQALPTSRTEVRACGGKVPDVPEAPVNLRTPAPTGEPLVRSSLTVVRGGGQ